MVWEKEKDWKEKVLERWGIPIRVRHTWYLPWRRLARFKINSENKDTPWLWFWVRRKDNTKKAGDGKRKEKVRGRRLIKDVACYGWRKSREKDVTTMTREKYGNDTEIAFCWLRIRCAFYIPCTRLQQQNWHACNKLAYMWLYTWKNMHVLL